MLRRFSVNFAILSIILDAVIIMLSLYCAILFRPQLNPLPFTQTILNPIFLPLHIYPLFAVIWIAIFTLFSVYDGRKNLLVTDELTALTLASIVATVSLSGTLYLSYRDISRITFISFILMAFTLMLIWRFCIRIIFRFRNGSRAMRKVIIIGAGPVGRDLEAKITKFPHFGLMIEGFLDDNLDKHAQNQDILGTLSQAREFILTKSVDDVVIALPRRAYEKVNQLVSELHDLPVKVWVIPDYFHLALYKASFEEFAGIPMLDLRAPAINDYQRMIKRAFDLIITCIALPPALLLMGLITLAIRLEGPGPIIIRQDRIGENGSIFGMYKFRTMVPNAERLRHLVEHLNAEGKFVHKTLNDPRVTRVGHILRRMSLDELPQLINILKGDMSLVGPRPELPYLVERYEPWQHKRFVVPQGLTGWWQVNGRSDKPMHLHSEDDIFYVQNYSLLLDIKILIKTIWVVLRGKGAY